MRSPQMVSKSKITEEIHKLFPSTRQEHFVKITKSPIKGRGVARDGP